MMNENDIRRMFREELQSLLSSMAQTNPSRLLNFREVEKQFGIKRGRLYELHKAGALFYIKEGRKTVWRESDVRGYTNQLKKLG